MSQQKSGCQVLNDLWQVALDCQVENPGITGTPSRIKSYVECSNVGGFMSMATMKCWQEMNMAGTNNVD